LRGAAKNGRRRGVENLSVILARGDNLLSPAFVRLLGDATNVSSRAAAFAL
jgi:hypothetical protein